jgi:type VI secretion system secreted protein VgrG
MAKTTQESRHLAIATPLGADALLLQSFSGSEGLSQLFSYDLELLREGDPIVFEDLIGQNATVRLETAGEEPRYFNGYVARLTQGEGGATFTQYRATLVPWLWFLTRSADCRIFQDMTVPDIIKQVCSDHGFTDIKADLSGTYNPRIYCVQYRETAFDFISRLMEHEGIYYYFSHENGKHTLCLCDSPTAHPPIQGDDQLVCREPKAGMELEAVWNWTSELELQPGICALNDFDFTATTKDLNAKALTTRTDPTAKMEIFDYPGHYDAAATGESYARIRLQEHESHGAAATGATSNSTLSVGATFNLAEHPDDAQNKKYLVTAASYAFSNSSFKSSGGGGESFLTSFRAVDAETQYRPRRTTTVPRIQGPQTAFVVGPSGQEIYTDEHGRVKVMFHWDRYAAADENSSCWVRVAQVWAGKQWGGIFTPRIGQEVVVEFLDGDPDRPLITGRVYNGTAKPPYPLPDMATISGIKSNSSMDGGGFNEIRFEDKKEEEQLFIHAQKNLDLRILNDRFESVGHDRHLIVKNDRIEEIGNDTHQTVMRDRSSKVSRDDHLAVEGKQAIKVTGSMSLTVDDDVIEVFNAKQSTQVADDLYIKATNVCIEATENITIKVGGSFIAIESSGIKIGTDGQIVIEAGSNAKITASASLSLEGSASAELKSPSTTVKGSGSLVLEGGMVKIN